MSLTSTSDSWDDPVPTSQPTRSTAAAQVVRDDWDDDDEEEDEDPQKLWETANKKAPMPQLVLSSSSTTTSVPPPPAAFQPTLRILKRPSASPGSSITNIPTQAEKQRSYAEREAQYQAARERIFQDKSKSVGGSEVDGVDRVKLSVPTAEPRNLTPVKILRDPRGPSTPPFADPSSPGDGGTSKGFASRRNAKNKSPRTEYAPGGGQ
ncbi:hypothetical protein CERSUDRAFT_95399 [Gelatoporia subvermispora B]|uniref:SUZ domain-containing protein n=1 Tax=Ceriporiopsis subvermispora (strain B) TaxID=914234 RepID=M2RFA2_CERS8|nr:hypothetical protein CERSUDRAFT_95399 [Gelatoporia subvermispora B]